MSTPVKVPTHTRRTRPTRGPGGTSPQGGNVVATLNNGLTTVS